MDEASKKTQENFLTRVKSALPPNIIFVEELADLLNVSTDSAYRRLRCETPLSITEVASICRHFKVSFDSDVQHLGSTVTFDYHPMAHNKEKFKLWMLAILNDVKRISQKPENTILYAADDVPIWHHYIDEKLTAFKIFYWLKCILGEKDFVNETFDPKLVDKELIQIGTDTLEYYNNVTSAEIYTEDTFNSTLKQVEYFWESGFFKSKEAAQEICDLITKEVNILQQKAACSSKLKNGKENFTMYRSEVMVGNNSILVNIGSNKLSYVSYNTFNFITTSNANFVQENEEWLKNLIKKSILISGVSEKQRNQFFKILRDKIDLLKRKIDS